MAPLRACLATAVREGLIRHNPARESTCRTGRPSRRARKTCGPCRAISSRCSCGSSRPRHLFFDLLAVDRACGSRRRSAAVAPPAARRQRPRVGSARASSAASSVRRRPTQPTGDPDRARPRRRAPAASGRYASGPGTRTTYSRRRPGPAAGQQPAAPVLKPAARRPACRGSASTRSGTRARRCCSRRAATPSRSSAGSGTTLPAFTLATSASARWRRRRSVDAGCEQSANRPAPPIGDIRHVDVLDKIPVGTGGIWA